MSKISNLVLAASAAAVLSITAAQADSLRSFDADRYNYGPIAAQTTRPAVTPSFGIPATATATFAAPSRFPAPVQPLNRPDSGRAGSDR